MFRLDIGTQGEPINTRHVNEGGVVELLDPTWDWSKFELAWQAFAEGMKRQRDLWCGGKQL
jgi:hypothetical protein